MYMTLTQLYPLIYDDAWYSYSTQSYDTEVQKTTNSEPCFAVKWLQKNTEVWSSEIWDFPFFWSHPLAS